LNRFASGFDSGVHRANFGHHPTLDASNRWIFKQGHIMQTPRQFQGTIGAALGLSMLFAADIAKATNYNIDWLSYAPVAVGAAPAPVGTYASSVPGVGPVTVSFSAVTGFTDARVMNPTVQNGSVTVGGDTFAWGPQEVLGRTYTTQGPNDPINKSWKLLYTLSNPLPAGVDVVLGVYGLGKRSPNPGEAPTGLATLAHVYSPVGTYQQLGDYVTSNNWGATQISTLPGSFTLENSVTALGGLDPNWNSQVALTHFTSAWVGNQLQLSFDQTLGDGIGVNIGFTQAVPEPESATLFLAGMVAMAGVLRRRMQLRAV
jgi:hypothetical protein